MHQLAGSFCKKELKIQEVWPGIAWYALPRISKHLAEASGITKNEISNIENGKRTVGKKVAEKLAKVLNFDYQMLLE